eukprot:TRINITY_DN974_c0_g1_i2.p2 TRINITY_DN974_c0_g1~~TRINITY_DN974_c0_g1_i2.p2  ORF type:complete len:119 (-),score=25.06 TRINITY_DN974_c0_g1_i2:67-423(-)
MASPPDWFPVGKYIHDGKDVIKITNWSDASGKNTWKIYYADGGEDKVESAPKVKDEEMRELIKKFDFLTQQYSATAFGGLDAHPVEDPAEFEDAKANFPPQDFAQGNMRKGCSYLTMM